MAWGRSEPNFGLAARKHRTSRAFRLRACRPSWGARIGRSSPLGRIKALVMGRSSQLGLAAALDIGSLGPFTLS